MAQLGYARVSTSQQSLDIQIATLKAEGIRDDRIFTDKASGKKGTERTGLDALMARAESGDEILVTKLDRLGRSTLEMISLVESWKERGVSVTFLSDGLSSAGSMGTMLITILSAVAQAERERILERTREGRIDAMANGVKFGRPVLGAKEKMLEMIAAGENARTVMEATGVSKATFYRALRAHRASTG